MFRFIIISTVGLFGLFLMAQCSEDKPKKLPISNEELKTKLMEMNQKRVHAEKLNIDSLLQTLDWNVFETGTGLRMEILHPGTGDSVQVNDVIELEYIVSMPLGDTLYSSKDQGTKEFHVGMDHVETGIHEAVSFMKNGSEARIVLPAHLAHGFLGDEKSIPSNAALFYWVKIVDVK